MFLHFFTADTNSYFYFNKNSHLKIAAVIPAFNEENSIAAVVEEIHAAAKESGLQLVPIVVNDCSTDSTSQIINSLNCVALHLPINLGIGGAVQSGFIYALENNFDYAVQIDGDGQHPPKYIPLLYKTLTEKNLDVVIASRYLDKKGFQSSAMRRTGIKYFSRLIKFLTGMKISDCTSGYRMINRKVLEAACAFYPDEYPEPEAIVLYSKYNFRTGEAAVEMRERAGGVSSIGTFSAVYYMLKVTLAVFFSFVRSKKVNALPENELRSNPIKTYS